MLLEKDRVDTGSRDPVCGRSPLSWAAYRGQDGVMKILPSKDRADQHSTDTLYGRSPPW